jgi:tetratricopeptide (TPR) repeat protein
VVLPFLSVRFIFLAAIVGGPIFARNISLFLHSLGLEKQCFTFLPTVVATIWLCVLPVVSLAHIPPFNFMAENRSFGLDFDHAEMPQGAVEYMEKNEIAGRILNSFSFGQYINWTSYPKRQVFVDARGYIPVDLLEKMDSRHEKDVDELEESYGFDTILYSANPSLTVGTAESTIRKMDLSFKHPDWAVVYWDDVCLLYLKRGGPYDNIVRRDEYLFVNPDMTSHVFLENLGGYDNRQRIAGELQRNIAETGSSRALLFLGILYHASNQYDKAVNAYLKVEDSFHNDFKENSYALLGDVYFKMQDYQKSLSYYKRVPGYENVPGIQHNIGKVYMNQGDSKAAAIAYEQALKIEKNTLKVYPDLINTYKSLGRVQDALNLEKQYNTLNSTQMAKMYFEEGVIAQQENRIDMAIEAYKKSLALNSDVPVIYANIGFIYLDKNQSDKAYESFNQALGLNPGFANAHYGIALFYKNKSLNEKSVYHFTKYCELEPTGYFYRKAQKEISELTK